MAGYRLALKECIKYIQEHLLVKVETLGKDAMMNVAKTSMNSKLIGSESDFFAEMALTAMNAVKVIGANGQTKVPVKSVHVLKCHGKGTRESMLVNGYALMASRASQGMPMKVKDAKIACIDFNLNKYKLQLGVQILVDDPANLEKIRQREMDVTKERCKKIVDAGATVILTARGIDDFALKYFVEAGAIAIRRVGKADLRRIAKSSGAQLILSMADFEGDEKFEPSFLGYAETVQEYRLGDNEFTFFEGFKATKAQTIILRGANEFMLDEIDRSLHDALCVIKRVLESKSVVSGGGAVETALSIYLEDFAKTLGSREQLAIAEFAEALLVIPKTLALNAAKDATDLIAKLRVFHNAAQTSEDPTKRDLKHTGLDLVNGKVRNNLACGVLEPAMSKIKSLKFATEAAITILRIDDNIKLSAAPQDERGGR